MIRLISLDNLLSLLSIGLGDKSYVRNPIGYGRECIGFDNEGNCDLLNGV